MSGADILLISFIVMTIVGVAYFKYEDKKAERSAQ